MALYNKMRPRSLAEVEGQDKALSIITADLKNGTFPHAALFTGTRGCGKTSVARIVNKAVNCLHPVNGDCCNECDSCKAISEHSSIDVEELDAASNNSVEDIRNLLERVRYKATYKYRVYIIDEVHMLSTAAFNALLKTLEEPPANVIFILCTTELHKVPATVVSRCRKYEFERITISAIVRKLEKINSIYGIKAEPGALIEVAKAAKGSLRDAESIYETFLNGSDILTAECVRTVLGLTDDKAVLSLLRAVSLHDMDMAFSVISELSDRGLSLAKFAEHCFEVVTSLLLFKATGDCEHLPLEDYLDVAEMLSRDTCFELTTALKEVFLNKNTVHVQFLFENAIMQCCNSASRLSLLEARVLELEKRLANPSGADYSFIPEESSDEFYAPNADDDFMYQEENLCPTHAEQPTSSVVFPENVEDSKAESVICEDVAEDVCLSNETPPDVSGFSALGDTFSFDELMDSLEEDIPGAMPKDAIIPQAPNVAGTTSQKSESFDDMSLDSFLSEDVPDDFFARHWG